MLILALQLRIRIRYKKKKRIPDSDSKIGQKLGRFRIRIANPTFNFLNQSLESCPDNSLEKFKNFGF